MPTVTLEWARNVRSSSPTMNPSQPTSVIKTMWGLLERLAEMERRVGTLYARFAEVFQRRPLVADFWRELAAEERLHAVVIAATREVFPPSTLAPPGEWGTQLSGIAQRLSAAERRASDRLPLHEALTWAEELEASELNTLTHVIVEHAGGGFSRLAPLVGQCGVDAHRDKLLQARRRFQEGEIPRVS